MMHFKNALKRYARGEFCYEFIARGNRRSRRLETWRRHYQHNSNIPVVVLVTWILYELRGYNLKSREIRKIRKGRFKRPFLSVAKLFHRFIFVFPPIRADI
jgi:hypothetical protein